MTPQEKQALLTFLGTLHGQAKHTDQQIVGQSTFLKPVSRDIQAKFAHELNNQANIRHENAVASLPLSPPPEMQEPVDVPSQQHVAVSRVAPSAISEESSNIVNALNKIHVALDKIVNILEQNGKVKNTKKARVV